MMGTKTRNTVPLIHISLEDLVPQDHFYRQLDHKLNLSFVYAFVQENYAQGGRPSIDPIVFFKLQLVMFFEDIRSERQLMCQEADRLSIRWYLGYNLDEALPDHSSLTRIRTRYGVEVFRRFFETVVDQCQQAGLVWGKELYADATKVQANAAVSALKPRFSVEAHLKTLFAREEEPNTLQGNGSLADASPLGSQRYRSWKNKPWALSHKKLRCPISFTPLLMQRFVKHWRRSIASAMIGLFVEESRSRGHARELPAPG